MKAATQAHPRATVANLRKAIEGNDAGTLAGLYSHDAVLTIIDRVNMPSHPRVLNGRPAIAAYYDDVCGRAMTHEIRAAVENDDRIAFTQACRYPDGISVFCSAMLELENGRIVRQMNVQAWDE